jgi:DNA-binding LacI/PurR family transcriptional regulator
MPAKTRSKAKITSLILQDNAPSFLGVRRALVSRIGTEWKVGDRLPAISDLARTMGVGQNNAQRAVKELVSEGILFSRRRLGVFVRQLPGDHAQQALDARLPFMDKTLGMAVIKQPAPFVQRMMDGFTQAVREAGGETRVVIADESYPVIPETTGLWGLAVFNPNSFVTAPPGKQNIVVVATAGHINLDLISRFDSVSVDQYQGGALAGRVLREAGCARVAFLGHKISAQDKRYDLTSSARLHGFECAWGKLLEPADLLYTLGYSVPSGAKAFAEYMSLSQRPDGVFAASDELAVGFIVAAASHGLKPGRDFQIVGFDGQDNDLPGDLSGMTLTTVRVPAAEMGRRAAQLMIKREADPTRLAQRVLLSCSISTVGWN